MPSFGSQISCEPFVLACGRAPLWSFERAAVGVHGAKAMTAAATAVGPWMDWSFGFFVLARLPLAGPGTMRMRNRRLVLPWLVALGSIAMVLLWMVWAKSAPLPQGGGSWPLGKDGIAHVSAGWLFGL